MHLGLFEENPKTFMDFENLVMPSFNFKQFSPESIRDINERIINENIRKEIERTDADYELSDSTRGKRPDKAQLTESKPNKELEVGKSLPKQHKKHFPKSLFGRPIEEIDDFYKAQYVFVVINRNYQIFRFNSEKALYCLSPFNKIRQTAIFLLTYPLFSTVVMLTILINCIIMALPNQSIPEFTEYIFTIIYTIEVLLKIIARGFIMNKFSFLRDGWNWLDFLVIILAYATIFIDSLGNLSVLRTLRVLRALKTVAIVPGLKTIVDSLVQSVIRLRDVIILTSFVLSVFALVGLQLYMGALKRKCVWNGPSNMTDSEYEKYINDSNNWVRIRSRDGSERYFLCGNSTGAMHCGTNSTCLPNIGENPNDGYTNFDSYGYAMLSAFRLINQDYWENLYHLILTAEGPFQVVYFIGVIFFGSFYLINLILAIVSLSYREQQIKAMEAAAIVEEKRKSRKEQKIEESSVSTTKKDHQVQNLSVSLNSLYRLYAKDTKYKRPVNNTFSMNMSDDKASLNLSWPLRTSHLSIDTHLNINNYQKPVFFNVSPHESTHSSVSFIDRRHSSTDSIRSQHEQSIDEFFFSPVESNIEPTDADTAAGEEDQRRHHVPRTRRNRGQKRLTDKKYLLIAYRLFCTFDLIPFYDKIKKFIGFFVLDAFADLIIMLCIIMNTVFLALDHHNMDARFSEFLSTGNYIFTGIFTAEAVLKIVALSPAIYFKNRWNIFDVIIIFVSLVELGLSSKKMSVLRTFRLLRVFKLAKSWPTLNQLMAIIGQTVGALGNLTFVLGIIIFIFAVMGNQLFGPKYVENKHLWDGGELPRWSFVDFFHSFLIVFRVLCGEWIESMWGCLRVAGWPCVPFFLFTMIIGNLVLLNLFLALLLSSFGADKLKMDDKDDEINKIQEAIDRIRRFCSFACRQIASHLSIDCNYLPTVRKQNTKSIAEPREPRISILAKLRGLASTCVEHRFFELFIIFMIILSSVSLAIEDKNIHTRPRLKTVLELGDKFFTIVFTLEIILKLLAFGWVKFFTDPWSWLDFGIVLVSHIGILASLIGLADLAVFKTIRTLRALRPLKALSRFEGIRVVVNSLIGAIPSIFNVMLVCLVFWLIFSIMGVQLFAGRFYKCVYPNLTRVPYELSPNKQECLAQNLTWMNSRVNFDNVLNAYLALLQVATFKGWIEIMADAADISQELNQQPRREQSFYMLLYFVFFIVFGSFFTLNLFIGVVIDNFNQQKKKYGGSIELFMSEGQKHYYNAMKKMGNKKPQKAMPRPGFYIGRLLFDITSNQKFDIFIMICIFLNMIAMCSESYGQSERTDSILMVINIIFISVFTAECLMKLIALNWRFFKIPWNIFDLFIVVLSILGMVFENFMKHVLTFSPTILRVVRVVRVGRVLRLVKGARGIRTLLFALAISMPALVNIGLLLFLVIFIYGIFGMNFFMYVKYDAGINELFNFETIYRSMITLFPLCTSAGWNEVFMAVTNDSPPDCDPSKPTMSQISKGDCGSKSIAAPYLVSYLIISFLVVINMYIAVILENFSQAREEVKQGLTDDDYDMYYEIWQKYDPKGTEFINYDKLSEFVESLEEPLGIKKPNRLKLISMNITICENNLVHCVDILDALTKSYLGTESMDQSAVPVPLEILKKDRPHQYKPKTSTLHQQRENYCAKIITKAVRLYAEKRKKIRLEEKLSKRIVIDELECFD